MIYHMGVAAAEKCGYGAGAAEWTHRIQDKEGRKGDSMAGIDEATVRMKRLQLHVDQEWKDLYDFQRGFRKNISMSSHELLHGLGVSSSMTEYLSDEEPRRCPSRKEGTLGATLRAAIKKVRTSPLVLKKATKDESLSFALHEQFPQIMDVQSKDDAVRIVYSVYMGEFTKDDHATISRMLDVPIERLVFTSAKSLHSSPRPIRESRDVFSPPDAPPPPLSDVVAALSPPPHAGACSRYVYDRQRCRRLDCAHDKSP